MPLRVPKARRVRRAVALLAGVAALLAGPQVGAARGADPVVHEVRVENHTRVRSKEIVRLLGIRTGKALDRREIERGLGLLARKVELGEVEVHAESGEGGLIVRVAAWPRLLARSVEIEGGPRRIRSGAGSRLQTREDRPVVWARLREDAAEIRKIFEEEGFPEARVEPTVRPEPSGQWARVVFHVSPGPPRRILEVEWPDLPMEPWRGRALLGLSVGDRASLPALRTGLGRLVTYLRRYGYPEARSGQAGFEPVAGGVRLRVPVEPGGPVRFRFEGVPEGMKRGLRSVLEERYGRPVDSVWLEEASRGLAEALQADGYRDARVAVREEGGSGGRVITFAVTLGPRVAVRRVRFHGNLSLSSRRLVRYLSLVQGGILRPPPFTTEALDRDLRVLEEYYRTKGFWDARVELQGMEIAPGGDAVLDLGVTEGPRYRWGEVRLRVEGAEPDRFEGVLGRIRKGDWADPGALEEVRRELVGILGKAGFPEGRVTYRTTVRPGETVDGEILVRAGPRVRVGRIVVSGNTRTQTKVVRRELALRPGEFWSPEAVRETRRRLYALGFFERAEVRPVPTLAPAGTRDLEVRVEEQDAGLFQFGLGYGTEEGVKGFLGLSHGNLGGYGRSLGGRYDFDRLERSLALNFREPWLFNHPWDLRLSLVSRTADLDAYNLRAVSFQSSVERALGPRARGSIFHTLEENRLSDVEEETAEAGDPNLSYLLSAAGFLLVWDSRDDPFNPRRGFYHTAQAEWASDILGSEVTYERYTATVSGYASRGRFTLAGLARGGLALTLGRTAELPVNKRFFLGGRTTVRGFRRDRVGPESSDGSPLGGDVMVNLRAELRYRWRGRLGLALFWDAGNVWNRSAESPDYGDLRQGAGAGLRYETPLGPLALDLGVNLDPREGEPRTVWHFTVGNAF